ncbi:MAG: zf-HC2 domain-containing protein [Ruminococcus sp.]|nr:zf-HC2 domain-containing protein [Ruminococcus sp.]
MRFDCDMICDLLPLYVDGACSKTSAAAVEQHLSECESCSGIYNDMIRCEKEIDGSIRKERDEVLNRQAKYFKRRSVLAGSIIGGIFSLPILICLIVNLATGAGLSWFFIVLTAMFIPASLTVVPLMLPSNKALWTLGTFTASLVTLLGVCCLYSGGSWFFVAASSVIFGLTVLFAPFAVNAKPIASRIGKHKALTAIGAMTVTFILMMICIGIRSDNPDFFRYAFAWSLPQFGYLWAMFLLIRYGKWHVTIKVAACVLVTSLYVFFGEALVILLLGRGLYLPRFGFGSLNSALYEDSIRWTVLFLGIIASAILTVIGVRKTNKH